MDPLRLVLSVRKTENWTRMFLEGSDTPRVNGNCWGNRKGQEVSREPVPPPSSSLPVVAAAAAPSGSIPPPPRPDLIGGEQGCEPQIPEACISEPV